MCRVQYAMCPEEVDCSGSTPVTGNIQLYLPGKLYYACIYAFVYTFMCVSFYSITTCTRSNYYTIYSSCGSGGPREGVHR